ncbi:MAG: type II secretion system F family protein [Verrucomicrobiia bacterium]|jgi:type II secretory pathway component PulF
MKYDEFAFFNQQLAAMLRDGIPLEGALRRLCDEMRRGKLRDELQALEADLARGTPMSDALNSRQLPELYKRMILVGIKSGDLPGALTMLADYFQQRHLVWTRLKGLMVYPLIVLTGAFLLSCFAAIILSSFIWPNLIFLAGNPSTPIIAAGVWMSPVFLALVLAVALITLAISPARHALRWRLPAFQEASLAQVASAMWLMLKSGVPLDDALALVEQMETGTSAEGEIALWRQRLTSGRGKFSELASPNKTFPPMFIWMVAQSGEDLAGGFKQAADIYQGRAMYRSELLLYSAMPCSILALAAMIACQIQPVFGALIAFIKAMANSVD